MTRTSGVGNAAERAAAEAYRRAELPFVLFGVAALDVAAREWTDDFLRDAFANSPAEIVKVRRIESNGSQTRRVRVDATARGVRLCAAQC